MKKIFFSPGTPTYEMGITKSAPTIANFLSLSALLKVSEHHSEGLAADPSSDFIF